MVVHLLFDPLIEAASAMGAGLDWKTSLQELAAEHGLGVPEYVIEDEGPDHMKTFTAQVRVGEQLYGNGVGRSKKEAEQAAAETAYGEIARGLGVPTAAPADRLPPNAADSPVPELPEVEVVRAGLERHVGRRAPSPRSRCCTPVRYAATRAGRRASPPR